MAQDKKDRFGLGKAAQKLKENKKIQELAQKTREALTSEREAEARDREIDRETKRLYEENEEIAEISRNSQSVSRNTQSFSRDTVVFRRDDAGVSRDTGSINREDVPRPKPVKKLRELEELERKARQAAEDARKETISFKREALIAAEKVEMQQRRTGSYTRDEVREAQMQQRRTGSYTRDEVREAQMQQRRTGSYTRDELHEAQMQQRRTGSYTRDELHEAQMQQRRTGSYARDEVREAQMQQRRTGSYTRDEVREAQMQQRRTGSYTRDEVREAQMKQRRTGSYTREELLAAGSPPKPGSPFGTDGRKPAETVAHNGQNRKKLKIGNKKKFTVGILLIVAVIALIIAVAVSCMGHETEKKEATGPSEKEIIMSQASNLAAMYDYDGAISLLKTSKDYENDEDITAAIAAYEGTKSTLVEYPVDQVTHIFFHALLVEPEVSFGEKSPMVDGFNIYMTTLDEFNKIIQSMYDKGYVLVSLYDVAKAGADGTFEAGKIMLPEGKKAFVLSEDDVCYYHAYDNGGIADKLIIDEESGKIKAQYTHQDGTVEVGDFDVLPALDTFIEQHPDFSYHGAKGILALTGYNGILGYRTDTTYDDASPDVADRDSHEQAWLDAHPGFNYQTECEEAKKVAEAIKQDGWYFASHSWGHKWQSSLGIESFTTDTKKWMDRVSPLIGGTDIWIYSNGEDVDTSAYQDRFKVLQDNGFKYFCTVNSNQYSTRIDSYGLNQGRRNLDGYRMYYDMINDNVDKLSDLFDVNAVFDQKRPTPVPQI